MLELSTSRIMRCRRIIWEVRIDITYTLLYIIYVTNKDLVYSTENFTQYSIWIKNLKKRGYMYNHN